METFWSKNTPRFLIFLIGFVSLTSSLTEKLTTEVLMADLLCLMGAAAFHKSVVTKYIGAVICDAWCSLKCS